MVLCNSNNLVHRPSLFTLDGNVKIDEKIQFLVSVPCTILQQSWFLPYECLNSNLQVKWQCPSSLHWPATHLCQVTFHKFQIKKYKKAEMPTSSVKNTDVSLSLLFLLLLNKHIHVYICMHYSIRNHAFITNRMLHAIVPQPF